MATNPVKGNLCHGFSFKQLDDNISNESGKTCMNPVPKMIPAAKHLTITNRLRSGLRAGIERVIRVSPSQGWLLTKQARYERKTFSPNYCPNYQWLLYENDI
ncbi:Uncharacterized protein Fot_37812 [Forsythia ovata]|uniref:Uncharacterized protein n=1 Tax=Forsythia ovata TaxID=205694 RepID=A0ABD1S024_9LAMI